MSDQDRAEVGGQEPVESWVKRGLSHGLRRQILRALEESDQPLSSVQLCRGWINASLTTMAYHMQSLRGFGAVEEVRTRKSGGSVQTFFRSSVAGHETVNRVLDETMSEDEDGPWPRRGSNPNSN